MLRHTLLFIFIFAGMTAFSQTLDRISISSGGKATDEVNYVIGETFSFSLAVNGNIIVEAGTLAGTGNTGGLTHNIPIKQLSDIKNIPCYPNPASDVICFTLNDKQPTSLIVTVFDLTGKLVKFLNTENSEIMNLDLVGIAPGTYITTVLNQQSEVVGSFQFIKQ